MRRLSNAIPYGLIVLAAAVSFDEFRRGSWLGYAYAGLTLLFVALALSERRR